MNDLGGRDRLMVYPLVGVAGYSDPRVMACPAITACREVFATADADRPAALIDLVTPDAVTEYWLAFENVYVITRYNRSSTPWFFPARRSAARAPPVGNDATLGAARSGLPSAPNWR